MITLTISLTLAFGIATAVHKTLMKIVDSSNVGLETKPKPEFYS
jgi:hypothetical protein